MKQPVLRLLLLVFGGLLPGRSQAQTVPATQVPRQTARLELPLQSSSSDVQVLAIPEDSSVVLLVEREAKITGPSTFTFQKLDKDLHSRWEKPLEVPERFSLAETCNEGSMVYALFQDDYLSNKLWIAALNSRTGDMRTTTYDTKLTHSVYSMKALDGNLFVTVQIEQHLTVLLLKLASGDFQFLPAVYEPLESQLTFLADSVAKQVKFVVSQNNGVKSRLQVKQISPQGKLLHSEFVQAESNRSLLTAQLSPGDSTHRLMAGTYTLRDIRYSQGLFATDLTQPLTASGARPSLRFYDFLNLKHFFDFMSPNRQARLRQRGARRLAADREFRLHYRLLMHDLLPSPEGYVLVAEIYFPHYRYNNYGFGFVGTARNFDGYHTTHAIVCGFDQHGNLLWDNTFVLKDVEHYNLEETVRIRPLPDGRYALTYIDDHHIRYKIIDRTAPSPNDWEVPVQTTLAADTKEKITNTASSDVQAWYGGRFLAFGYQHVRAPNWNGRDVFFVNTIDFE
ncbi:hypothetical protein [Hymenobacter chitinivorans]|uniref:Uncharacterized protein n=1 Tax=Hymenobacter chitinivorans DSM 11115 TaxID=1121954 RepID=A0A2M9BAN4_9BACT|nr:hypothetical protein [Hymenobacter chitinivorans]PJJ55002.1 hypothetical protein CLV45_3351 [Hymenobacter chitinivorans DSM 11115]